MSFGKYLHLVDPTTEDQNDLPCKVRPLVAHLDQKIAEAYIPGKNITVDEGLVKFKGELKAKINIFFNIFFGKSNICKVRFVELFLPFSRLLRENYA